MDPATLILLASIGLGSWGLARRAPPQRRLPGDRIAYDEDADVAIHVATHAAKSRGHKWLSSVHVLYGLLQDDAVTEAIRTCGGDPAALEDRALAALDEHVTSVDAGKDGGTVLEYARMMATQRDQRPSCTDLWAALRRGPVALALCKAAGVDHTAVLFRLIHGDEPALGERLTGELDVALRNDHYTTKEFVQQVLRDVFALEPTVATTQMERVHAQGSAVVGRYRAVDARTKVAEVRRLAIAAGHPLWIGVEPA